VTRAQRAAINDADRYLAAAEVHQRAADNAGEAAFIRQFAALRRAQTIAEARAILDALLAATLPPGGDLPEAQCLGSVACSPPGAPSSEEVIP